MGSCGCCCDVVVVLWLWRSVVLTCSWPKFGSVTSGDRKIFFNLKTPSIIQPLAKMFDRVKCAAVPSITSSLSMIEFLFSWLFLTDRHLQMDSIKTKTQELQRFVKWNYIFSNTGTPTTHVYLLFPLISQPIKFLTIITQHNITTIAPHHYNATTSRYRFVVVVVVWCSCSLW